MAPCILCKTYSLVTYPNEKLKNTELLDSRFGRPPLLKKSCEKGLNLWDLCVRNSQITSETMMIWPLRATSVSKLPQETACRGTLVTIPTGAVFFFRFDTLKKSLALINKPRCQCHKSRLMGVWMFWMLPAAFRFSSRAKPSAARFTARQRNRDYKEH